MSEGRIRVEIDYEGTQVGASQLDGLTDKLRGADEAQRTATVSASALGESASTLGGAAGRTGSALGQMAQVIASSNPSMRQSATLLSQMGGAATGLTGAMGPLGVALAAATVAYSIFEAGQRRAQEAADAERATIQNLTTSYDDLRSAIARARGERERDAMLARGEGSQEDFEAQARRFENRATQLRLIIREISRNDDLSRQERTALTRMRGAQLAAAQRAAESAREHIAGGNFVVDVESGFTGAGSGVPMPEDRRRGGGRRSTERTFAQQEAEAWGEAQAAHQLYTEMIEEAAERENALALQQASIDTQLHDNGMARLAERTEGIEAHYEQIRQREDELADKRKEAARTQQRANASLAQEVGGVGKQIASAYSQAFQLAIEGTMSLEDAMLSATKAILKSIGEELVAKGIGAILEGISMLPSPTAAPKIGGGVAMVAFGVGLGAAGAAIPSPSSAGAEVPREQPDSGDSGGPKEVTIVFGNPVLTAGTQAQLARGMQRALGGDRMLPSSVGG